jgi:hypothetical protein
MLFHISNLDFFHRSEPRPRGGEHVLPSVDLAQTLPRSAKPTFR